MSAAGLEPKQPRHVCGREIPVMVIPPDLLRFYGWQPDHVWSVVTAVREVTPDPNLSMSTLAL